MNFTQQLYILYVVGISALARLKRIKEHVKIEKLLQGEEESKRRSELRDTAVRGLIVPGLALRSMSDANQERKGQSLLIWLS